VLGAALGWAAGLPVAAGASERPGAPLPPQYRQACAACHVAFPPQRLPVASWQRILGNLRQHYGIDASLDPATVRSLSAWLSEAAQTNRQAPPPEDRITRSAWFVREHHEVPAGTWKLPAVRSAANCAACHTRANEGDFNERHIVLPR
jgi:hypothetical protein